MNCILILFSSSTASGYYNNTCDGIKKSRHDVPANVEEKDNHKNLENDWLIKKCYINVTPIQWNAMATSSSHNPTNNQNNDAYSSSIATSSIFSGRKTYSWSKNSWPKIDQNKVDTQNTVDLKGMLMIDLQQYEWCIRIKWYF